MSAELRHRKLENPEFDSIRLVSNIRMKAFFSGPASSEVETKSEIKSSKEVSSSSIREIRASKNFSRLVQPSPLSFEAASDVNFRGLINLAGLLLIVLCVVFFFF